MNDTKEDHVADMRNMMKELNYLAELPVKEVFIRVDLLKTIIDLLSSNPNKRAWTEDQLHEKLADYLILADRGKVEYSPRSFLKWLSTPESTKDPRCNHEAGAIEYHNNAVHCTQCQSIFTLEEWKAMRCKSSPTEVPVCKHETELIRAYDGVDFYRCKKCPYTEDTHTTLPEKVEEEDITRLNHPDWTNDQWHDYFINRIIKLSRIVNTLSKRGAAK